MIEFDAVLAMQMLADLGAPGEGGVPDGALAHMDFGNEVYWLGEERSFSDLITGATVGLGGIEIAEANANRPVATELLRSAFTAGMNDGLTVVLDFTAPSGAGSNNPVLSIYDHADPDQVTDFVEIQANDLGTDAKYVVMSWATFSVWTLNGENRDLNMPGLNRVAATMARDIGGGDFEHGITANGMDVSFNGQNETGSDNSAVAPVESVWFFAVDPWDWVFDGVIWHRLTLFPAQAVENLPALSDLA